jgi:hypothetical protein
VLNDVPFGTFTISTTHVRTCVRMLPARVSELVVWLWSARARPQVLLAESTSKGRAQASLPLVTDSVWWMTDMMQKGGIKKCDDSNSAIDF